MCRRRCRTARCWALRHRRPLQARSWHPAWVVGAALCVLLLGVFASLLTGRGPEDAARQQQMLRDIQRAITVVDPALRLQIGVLPDGRARVSGWVAGIEQFDRLAEGLAGIRPTPALAVRTASDLLDDLRAVGGSTGASLRFELLGAGRVKALGGVLTTEEHDRVLAQSRERLPPGIEMVDTLRVPEQQGPAIQDCLRPAGFEAAAARRDATAQQMALALLPPATAPACPRPDGARAPAQDLRGAATGPSALACAAPASRHGVNMSCSAW